MSAANPRHERADATRQSLIAAARVLFGERGYQGTSVDEVVRAAGVTKGALYHHFRDKDELFRSVVEEVKRDVTVVVAERFVAAAEGPDPIETIVLGCHAYIDAFSDPAVQRIAVSDARAVLDATTRRDLDARYEVALVRGALRRAMNMGAIARQPLVPLAHMLTGALSEACALIAESDDKKATQQDARSVVASLLGGLRVAG
ncbi:MAG: TetR family transcriptional regulator [Actinomycetota bacterium]